MEFTVTLPATTGTTGTRVRLPQDSSEIARAAALTDRDSEPTYHEAQILFEHLERLQKGAKRPLRVLVVDDEALYREAIESQCDLVRQRCPAIDIASTDDAQKALELMRSGPTPDLVILDVDLGVGSPSGIEALKQIRQQGYLAYVCIHSSRVLAEDCKVALSAGADAVLPKPLSSALLLRLLIDSQERPSVSRPQSSHAEFVVVEDSEFILSEWEQSSTDSAHCHGFRNPQELIERARQSPEFLLRQRVVIIDFYFADQAAMDGIQLAQWLRSDGGYSGPIVLASDRDFTESNREGWRGTITAVVKKDVIGLSAVLARLSEAQAN